MLSHFDENGKSHMVDVSYKDITTRTAVAGGTIIVGADILKCIENKEFAKGDVLEVARIAGIMAAKTVILPAVMNHTRLSGVTSIS